ncbi:MAG: D-alanyl-D-alanine carboxypeptidase family protein [Actinomycetota bacterium]|nr:D-alanyl-D-alanine carboxypeptidase family protein [Actinomycetota bacterium]
MLFSSVLLPPARLRLWFPALATAVALALTVTTASPTIAEPDAPVATTAKAERLQDRLALRDKQLKELYAKVVKLRAEVTKAAKAVKATDAELARSNAELQEFANAAYRQQQLSTEMHLLLSDEPERDTAEALHSAAYLQAVTATRTQVLNDLATARAEAAAAHRRATQLLAQITDQQTKLNNDIVAIRVEAERSAILLEDDESRASRDSTRSALNLNGACKATGGAKWGGFGNGRIPEGALRPLSASGQMLRCDAADSFERMRAAFVMEFGEAPCVGSSYRSYRDQVRVYSTKPHLAARPGTSNHGWGVAIDFCGGIEKYGSRQYTWMSMNAPRFGWVNPEWARPGGSKFEPWHWEYGDL